MIRILIAGDHAIVRGGLKQIIATMADIAVAGEAAQGAEVIEKLCVCRVDLLLLDMTMPGISGVDLIRRVRTEPPALAIPVLSIHNEARTSGSASSSGSSPKISSRSQLPQSAPAVSPFKLFFFATTTAPGTSIRQKPFVPR